MVYIFDITLFDTNNKMNLKSIFGTILTILGIGGLIYSAVLFVNSSGSNSNVKALMTYGILGLIFFTSGIGLVRSTNDKD